MPDQQKRRHPVALDQPSDELVNRALQKMNERLADQRARAVSAPPVRARRARLISLAAAAAALCVLLLSRSQTGLDPLSFSYQPDPRLSAVSKTEAAGQEDLTALRSRLDEQMQPDGGYTRTDFVFDDFAVSEDGPVLWFAKAEYEGNYAVELTQTNFATTLHRALENAAVVQIAGREVRTGVDHATGAFFAVWQADDRYVQLQLPAGAQMKDKQKKEAVEQMMGMLR